MLNVKQNMERIQGKQGFSVYTLKKKSAVTKLSDTINGQHSLGFFLVKRSFPEVEAAHYSKKEERGK